MNFRKTNWRATLTTRPDGSKEPDQPSPKSITRSQAHSIEPRSLYVYQVQKSPCFPFFSKHAFLKTFGFPQRSRLLLLSLKFHFPPCGCLSVRYLTSTPDYSMAFCPSLLHCLPLGSCWDFSLSARRFFSFKLWQNCAWPSSFFFLLKDFYLFINFG